MPYKDIKEQRRWGRENYQRRKHILNERHKHWNREHKEEKKYYDIIYRKVTLKRRMATKEKWRRLNPEHEKAIKMLYRWKIKSTPSIINLLKLYYLVKHITKGVKNGEKKLKIYIRNCRNTGQSC